MKVKKKLWIRKLACGHERATHLNFISGIYTKPKVNDTAYCRECCKEVKINKVREASKNEIKDLKEIIRMIK